MEIDNDSKASISISQGAENRRLFSGGGEPIKDLNGLNHGFNQSLKVKIN